MAAQFEMPNDVIRRNPAMRHGLHDHLIRTAEARRRQAEAIATRVHWLWTTTRRALGRLINGKSGEPTPAADGRQISRTLGRASVADGFRRELLRLVRLIRRHILEPSVRGRRRRIAIAQLSSLDDRLLADIGLTRGQIELAVDGMLPRRGESCSWPVGRSVPAERVRHELPLAA